MTRWWQIRKEKTAQDWPTELRAARFHEGPPVSAVKVGNGSTGALHSGLQTARNGQRSAATESPRPRGAAVPSES